MGVSIVTASATGSSKKPVDAELNLVPFIDLLVCCICFLLITAVWVQMSRIEVNQTGRGPAQATVPEMKAPNVVLLVADDGYTITVGGERQRIPMQGAVYDTEGLAAQLRHLRARVPDGVELTVAAEDHIKYSHLIRAMDVALGARFSGLHVSDASVQL